ncbi:MAG: hypothetical protein IIC67_05275, partial [Thaumarchaeota archaeon]|nr:hypothetical protein [Nitrososphaerota archaeon]
ILMPKLWFTSPRGAKEKREELLNEGFWVDEIKVVMIKIKGKPSEKTWLVNWRT